MVNSYTNGFFLYKWNQPTTTCNKSFIEYSAKIATSTHIYYLYIEPVWVSSPLDSLSILDSTVFHLERFFFSTAEPIFFSLLQHFLFNQQKCIDFTHTGFNQKVNREKTSSNELLNCAQRFLKHEIFHLRLYLCNPKHNITCFTWVFFFFQTIRRVFPLVLTLPTLFSSTEFIMNIIRLLVHKPISLL